MRRRKRGILWSKDKLPSEERRKNNSFASFVEKKSTLEIHSGLRKIESLPEPSDGLRRSIEKKHRAVKVLNYLIT